MAAYRQTPKRDFLTNSDARQAGMDEDFWQTAYDAYLDAAERDPRASFDKFDLPRAVQLPFNEGLIEVIVRVQPDPREYRIIRLTAFQARTEDIQDPDRADRWNVHRETRTPLGEAALLDENFPW